MSQLTPAPETLAVEIEGSQVLKDSRQELADIISSFSSPTEVATFVLGLKHNLELENHKLRQNCLKLESENALLKPQMVTAESFHCFPKLPAELRARIWVMALPEARFVELDWAEDWSDDDDLEFLSCPGNHHPAILHVCREARAEILKKHPLCNEEPGGIPRFFNHTRDILYFAGFSWQHCELDQVKDEKMGEKLAEQAGFDPLRLRCFATDSYLWSLGYSDLLVHFLSKFPLLEEFTLIYYENPNRHGPHSDKEEVGPFEIVDLDDMEFIFQRDAGREYRILASKFKNKVRAAFAKDVLDNPRLVQPGKLSLNPWFVEKRRVPHIQLMRRIKKRSAEHKFDMMLLEY